MGGTAADTAAGVLSGVSKPSGSGGAQPMVCTHVMVALAADVMIGAGFRHTCNDGGQDRQLGLRLTMDSVAAVQVLAGTMHYCDFCALT